MTDADKLALGLSIFGSALFVGAIVWRIFSRPARVDMRKHEGHDSFDPGLTQRLRDTDAGYDRTPGWGRK